ncbi:TPA: type II secretion system protein [Candidatus Ventrenecus stercoripullorum]|nr:type II secretion system protein [Candidatus Ventrenecus stercoripullorum]
MKNNNSGFTLVELLGVIVIIGILATVAGLAVFQIIHNQQEKLLEDQIATLKDTAVTYVLSKETYLESCGNALDTNNPDCYVNVSINDLIEEGFFENRGDICDTNKSVIVYKRTEGLITELESYVEDGVCSY